MATNIDSALMPLDPALMLDEPALEIEVEDPEAMRISAGGVEIILEPEAELPDAFDANLAETLDEGVLDTLASDLIELVDADITSRKDWVEM